MAACRLMDVDTQSADLSAVGALAAELGDLKRLHDSNNPESFACRLFRSAWGNLAAGRDPLEVALSVTADALAAIRLGGINKHVLSLVGAPNGLAVLQQAFDDASSSIEPWLRGRLRDALSIDLDTRVGPDFVDALILQPRAGATCPGKPRIVLHPIESHGDHCLAVAVLGVVLSAEYQARPEMVFVAGLAHHLHNALLPDSGYAAEQLLGDALNPIMSALFDQEIAKLSSGPAEFVRQCLSVIGDAETPEGRAFHAADVLDRVVQMSYYENVARFRAVQALNDLQLVHAGPVQAFHHQFLSRAGLR